MQKGSMDIRGRDQAPEGVIAVNAPTVWLLDIVGGKIRLLLWKMNTREKELVEAQVRSIQENAKRIADEHEDFDVKYTDRLNTNCSSCGATGARIVNKLGKCISKEEVITGYKPRLVAFVKFPIYIPEAQTEMRNRTNPIDICHCNGCGNEWKKQNYQHYSGMEECESFLNVIKYGAMDRVKGVEDSVWLSDYSQIKIVGMAWGGILYRETIFTLMKEVCYDEISSDERKAIRAMYPSVMGGIK